GIDNLTFERCGSDSDCDDHDQCTDDHCDAVLGCAHVNSTGPCDDGYSCTINDQCDGNRVCAGRCPVLDSDGDGETDTTDRCPTSPAGELVDDGGCSRAQFCAGFDPRTRDGARACRKADWKNDEPLMHVREQGDCAIDKGNAGLDDDRCI